MILNLFNIIYLFYCKRLEEVPYVEECKLTYKPMAIFCDYIHAVNLDNTLY